MSKKEELDKEDLKFLKQLLGNSKKEEIKIPDSGEFKLSKNKISVNSIKEGLIQFNKNYENMKNIGAIESKLGKNNLATFQNHNILEKQKKKLKRKKIKKKELFLEVAEALPYIKLNNILLNKLIQHCISIENAIKALTDEPIEVKILK
jgi:hypothetical protein